MSARIPDDVGQVPGAQQRDEHGGLLGRGPRLRQGLRQHQFPLLIDLPDGEEPNHHPVLGLLDDGDLPLAERCECEHGIDGAHALQGQGRHDGGREAGRDALERLGLVEKSEVAQFVEVVQTRGELLRQGRALGDRHRLIRGHGRQQTLGGAPGLGLQGTVGAQDAPPGRQQAAQARPDVGQNLRGGLVDGRILRLAGINGSSVLSQ